MLRGVSGLAALLDLRGEQAVVVGGGAVALRRSRTLLEAGLQVQVIAPHVRPELLALPLALSVSMRVEHRPYRSGDLRGARVVVAATDDAIVNAQVVAEALALGLLVNHAGDATQGNLRFPMLITHAGAQVAVSTGRELPMLAQAISARVQAILPAESQLDAWVARREHALTLPEPERHAALAELRHEISEALGASVD